MKKLFFSAMACIAFAGSAFASNEVVTEDKLSTLQYFDLVDIIEFESSCTVTFTYIDAEGEPGIISFTRKGLSSEGCTQFQIDQENVLKKRGYTRINGNKHYVNYDDTINPRP